MVSLLLAVIYLAFISFGLPDSLLGSAWPVMYRQLNAPMSWAGIVSMIIAGGTIISSLFSDWLTRKLGVGPLTAISVLMTAVAMFGFSLSGSFAVLCLWAIPYGLGAGAVDVALNNYVALHYASRHMNWLHCCWGVGAAISPYIMSYCLGAGFGWQNGYRTVSIIQIILTAIMFISLPLWQKRNPAADGEKSVVALTIPVALKIRGVKSVLVAFIGYCSFEAVTGLWASSYLVGARGIEANVAALFVSLYYLGITAGRFLCGFFSHRVGDKSLVRIGSLVMLCGVICLAVPVKNEILPLAGLVVAGVGCAPIYPALVHETPNNFGKEHSRFIIGMQVASGYIGNTFMPSLFGWIADLTTITLYPLWMLFFAVVVLLTSELLNRSVSGKMCRRATDEH